MPATTQEKQDYVNVINAIWGVGVIPQNTIDNINDDVIEKVDVALTSIRECSKAMIGIDAVFSIFYGTTYSSWKALLAAAREEVSKTGPTGLTSCSALRATRSASIRPRPPIARMSRTR